MICLFSSAVGRFSGSLISGNQGLIGISVDGNYLLGLSEKPFIEAAYEGRLSELPDEERQEIEDYIEFRHQKWLREHGKD